MCEKQFQLNLIKLVYNHKYLGEMLLAFLSVTSWVTRPLKKTFFFLSKIFQSFIFLHLVN